jgi:hypothetical protein
VEQFRGEGKCGGTSSGAMSIDNVNMSLESASFSTSSK